MLFGEKLRKLREEKGISMEKLANIIGITSRALSNYELKSAYPKKAETLQRLSDFFGVTTDYLIDAEDVFLDQAQEKYGYRGRSGANRLVKETQTLFAGGELSETDKELFFKSITEIYFESKEIAHKKFTPKKYNKISTPQL